MKLISYSVLLNCVLWCSAAVLQNQEAALLPNQKLQDFAPNQVNEDTALENLRFVATVTHDRQLCYIISKDTSQSSIKGKPNGGGQNNVQKIVEEILAAQKKAKKQAKKNKKKGNGKKGSKGTKEKCKPTKCHCNGSTTVQNDITNETGTTKASPSGQAQTTNKGVTPEGTTPVGTTPVGTTPVGTTPVGTTPVGTTPVGTTPVGTTPADEYGEDYQNGDDEYEDYEDYYQ